MDEQNCDEWAIVDFGHGVVEVRCTAVGEHTKHHCLVEFLEPDQN